MSKHLAELELKTFRNVRPTRLVFRPGINVVLGKNAAGKDVLAAKRSWAEFLEALERTQLPQRLGGDGSSP